MAAGCDRKTEETPAQPAAGDTAVTSDAELMAAAEAAAKASADPASAASGQPEPMDAPPPPTDAPAATGAVPGLTLGTDYKIIPNGQPFEPLNGKIEVVEVFNFVCPACASFQPLVVSWKKRLPPDVRFTYVPAAFGGNWDQFVRSYYAAQTMGIAEKAHEKTYDAIHLEDKLKGERGEDSDAAIAAFYSQFGVDAKQFAGNMRSFAVTGKYNKARQYIISAGVNSTPTVIVNGKYKVEGRSFEDKVRIADILIAHERGQGASATP
ncbi:MAG: thiol:disulfide interchange protein DsbA/DsbL [Lysobacteraceae bacterium]|nr:MAG: thiol:disulfide interchange protein DsbA/DsbL [Xanthomonadaceae bacterium]